MAAITLPKIVYGGGPTTLQFKRGPQAFVPYWKPRLHDNVSTSGAARERVVENPDILISFQMQHLVIDDDMPGWMTFMAFALAGGEFEFFPNSAMTDFYNCVDDLGEWAPKYTAPKKYSASFRLRVLVDAQTPSDPGVILKRFYGI